jgi:hypothetical protein
MGMMVCLPYSKEVSPAGFGNCCQGWYSPAAPGSNLILPYSCRNADINKWFSGICLEEVFGAGSG